MCWWFPVCNKVHFTEVHSILYYILYPSEICSFHQNHLLSAQPPTFLHNTENTLEIVAECPYSLTGLCTLLSCHIAHLSLYFQLYICQVAVHSSVCTASSGFHKLATRTIWADLSGTRSDNILVFVQQQLLQGLQIPFIIYWVCVRSC